MTPLEIVRGEERYRCRSRAAANGAGTVIDIEVLARDPKDVGLPPEQGDWNIDSEPRGWWDGVSLHDLDRLPHPVKARIVRWLVTGVAP